MTLLGLLAQVAWAGPPVVVARGDLYPGVSISPDDLAIVKDYPPTLLPSNFFSDPAEVVGKVPVSRILADEVIRKERFDPDRIGPLEADIPPEHFGIYAPLRDGAERPALLRGDCVAIPEPRVLSWQLPGGRLSDTRIAGVEGAWIAVPGTLVSSLFGPAFPPLALADGAAPPCSR